MCLLLKRIRTKKKNKIVTILREPIIVRKLKNPHWWNWSLLSTPPPIVEDIHINPDDTPIVATIKKLKKYALEKWIKE